MNDHLDVRGPDEEGALFQLAARWAERYARAEGEDERAALKRFRATREYLDAVIHGIEPRQTLTRSD